MRIHLKCIGDLRDYLSRETQEIDLANGSSFSDLLSTIAERWGGRLPPYLWDPQEHRFRGAVFFVIDKQVVQDLYAPLEDGSEVILMRALSGG
jgi:molybdopterin converting factor small subunit